MVTSQYLLLFSFSLILLDYVIDAYIIKEVVKPQRCNATMCADPPMGCVAFATKNELNCPVACRYSCGAPWCPTRTCVDLCSGDYARDASGCVTCECKTLCDPLRQCWINCHFGYLRDRHGCKTCACAFEHTPPSRPEPPAEIPTSTSWENKMDTEVVKDVETTTSSSSTSSAITDHSLQCFVYSETTTNKDSMN